MCKKLIYFVCLVLMLAMVSTTYGETVIGDWELSPDGWIDWGNKLSVDDPANMPTKTTGTAGYQYEGSVGVTLNDGSLEVTQSGWGQSLSIQLDAAGRAAFMANDTFSIDMSVAANDGTITEGYTQIYELAMNAAGPDWTPVATGNPINFYWWPGSSERTETLEVDYTAFRDAITGTDYIEIIFALNTGGGAPPEMYFDNAKLTPEPATICLLGLGGIALIRRRK